MPRRNESFGELLLKAPWWVSAALGLAAFAAMRWGLPLWAGSDKTRQLLTNSFVALAPVILLLFALLSLGAFWFGRRQRALLESQDSLATLRALPWKQFEFLVAEAYRRQGYQVDYSLTAGADGGVDLVLRRTGRTTLVQCKQWKVFSVGAPVIREMFGLMTAERADAVIIVTSGAFTSKARTFAEGKPIQLVDGPELLALIQSVQSSPTPPAPNQAGKPDTAAPACPLCQELMVLRTARRGSHAGNQFWGCGRYPVCKGTRPA